MTSSRTTSATPLPTPDVETVTAHCDTHGPYQARMLADGLVTSACQACRAATDARKVSRAKTEADAAQQLRIKQRREESGIPARFIDKTFADYIAKGAGQRRAKAACVAFAEAWAERAREGISLVLTGDTGTGKTHLACAIGTRVIDQHAASVAFGTVATVLREIKDTYRKDSARSEQDVIDDYTRVQLLILDEVGVQTGSEHEKLLMFEVLNRRYQECRPTILISNLSADQLEEFLGQRIMDRYRECGVVLAFDWDSHRGRGAA